jgi:hypothetical protein
MNNIIPNIPNRPANKYFAMRNNRNGGFVGVYPSRDSTPYMLLFRSRHLAEKERRRIEWLAETKPLSHSNARVFQRGVTHFTKHKKTGDNQSISTESAVRFVVGRPTPEEVYWIGESKANIDRNRTLALESVSDEQILSLKGQHRIGMAIITNSSWADARGMTYACVVIEPDPITSDSMHPMHPWMLETLLNTPNDN